MSGWLVMLLVVNSVLICWVEGEPTTVATELTLITRRAPWNAAYDTCRSRGRQLMTIDSFSKQTAADDILEKLYQQSTYDWDDIWLGMASLQHGGTEYTTVSCTRQTYFRWERNEPNYQNSDLCVRWMYNTYNNEWGTLGCDMEEDFVCERSIGPCWFEERSRRKLDDYRSNTERTTACSLQECQNLCWTASSTSQPERQCAAGHYNSNTRECVLRMATALYVTNSGPSSSYFANSDDTLFIKRCYNYSVDDGSSSSSKSGNFPDLICDSVTTTTPQPPFPTPRSTCAETTSTVPETSTAGTTERTTSVAADTTTAGTTEDTSAAVETTTTVTTQGTTNVVPETTTGTTTEGVTSIITETATAGTTEGTTSDAATTAAGTTDEASAAVETTQGTTNVVPETTTGTTTEGGTSMITETTTAGATERTTSGTATNAAGTTDEASAAVETTTTVTTQGTTSVVPETTTAGTTEETTSAAVETTATGTTQRKTTVAPAGTTESTAMSAANEITTAELTDGTATPVTESTKESEINETWSRLTTATSTSGDWTEISSTMSARGSTGGDRQPTSPSPHGRQPEGAKRRCGCRCAQKNRKRVQASMETIQHDLHLQREQLSGSRRKLTSAPDARKSAHILGWAGVSFLAGVFALLLLVDCVRLAQFLQDFFREERRHRQAV